MKTNQTVRDSSRAPLLLVAGGKDPVVPSSVVKANFDNNPQPNERKRTYACYTNHTYRYKNHR